jgi:hypothetical protein
LKILIFCEIFVILQSFILFKILICKIKEKIFITLNVVFFCFHNIFILLSIFNFSLNLFFKFQFLQSLFWLILISFYFFTFYRYSWKEIKNFIIFFILLKDIVIFFVRFFIFFNPFRLNFFICLLGFFVIKVIIFLLIIIKFFIYISLEFPLIFWIFKLIIFISFLKYNKNPNFIYSILFSISYDGRSYIVIDFQALANLITEQNLNGYWIDTRVQLKNFIFPDHNIPIGSHNSYRETTVFYVNPLYISFDNPNFSNN